MKTKKIGPEGQIIVILAIAMVALIGITALAVDGSLTYNDRRRDQSTADSAALAGAGAAAQSLKNHKLTDGFCGQHDGTIATGAALQAAKDSALEDDVTLVKDDPLNGITITCLQDHLDIKVTVTSDTQTTFARVIGRDTIRTTVNATSRVYPPRPFAAGNGLFSCSDKCGNKDGGIDFSGTSHTIIKLAGAYSRTCVKATSGSTIVEVIGGPRVHYWTSCDGCSGANITPPAEKAPVNLPCPKADPPKCTDTAYNPAATSGTINPGNYEGINVDNGKELQLTPGLYCLKGDLTNGSKSILRAEKVTLYFLSGNVTINQNDDGLVIMSAPDCTTTDCGVPDAIRGMLMYFDTSNSSYKPDVTLNGGATNIFEGTIYGPKANFKINGNSTNDTFKTQIIGNYIYVSGSSNLNMNLEGAEIYTLPSTVELLK